MDFDHRKRVYMTGFMHCNQRVKQGIWIDRMIIGLILYSCFFFCLMLHAVLVMVLICSYQSTAQYRSWVIHSWLLFFTGFGVRHCGRLASTRSWSSCFGRVGLMKPLQRRICFCYHIFSFSRLGTIHGNIWTTFKRIERCSLQTSAALNLNITIQQSRCIFRLLKAVYR